MSISWVHRANICTIINFSTKYYKWSYCLACSLNREPSNHRESGQCDVLRPMSHLRFYRAILSRQRATLLRDKVTDAVTVKLHAANLSYKQTRLLYHFPALWSSLTDTVPKWWNCSISNLFELLHYSYAFETAYWNKTASKNIIIGELLALNLQESWMKLKSYQNVRWGR